MQHTDKYNFNLIETSDTFSPEPLNKNTEAIEAQLAAVRGEFAAADAALDAAKAPQTALAAETAAREAALAALAGRGRWSGKSCSGSSAPTSVRGPAAAAPTGWSFPLSRCWS